MSGSTTRGVAISATLLITCAVFCAALAMGVRQSFGLFLAPMTEARGWSTSDYAFALALQVLINGIAQPFCGQIADRIGARAVVMGGAVLYGLATTGMALTENLALFTLFAGLGMGIAVSAAGMPVIIASLTRQLPENRRGRAVGLGTAGSSFGQFFVVPIAAQAIYFVGWQGAMLFLAALTLIMLPLALPLANEPPKASTLASENESAGDALKRALRSTTFWCLFFGFFVCGMHVSFLSVHLPGFVHLCGLPLYVGAGAISLIGLFNIAGSLIAGELSQRWRRRELLIAIYTLRGILMTTFLMVEKTTTTVLVFSALMGILWLSTVPPTIALVARNFGTRWLATIFGIVFLGHQLGGFTGAFLGGIVFDRTGNYDLMWTFGIAAAAFAALIHIPINDPRPVAVAVAAE
ncbi:MAG: putative arabinose efflux permease, family [Rhodospirillales bacterium]|nr:putative arabinose efflux permease, family [Rhodospirillales bacterium]